MLVLCQNHAESTQPAPSPVPAASLGRRRGNVVASRGTSSCTGAGHHQGKVLAAVGLFMKTMTPISSSGSDVLIHSEVKRWYVNSLRSKGKVKENSLELPFPLRMLKFTKKDIF